MINQSSLQFRKNIKQQLEKIVAAAEAIENQMSARAKGTAQRSLAPPMGSYVQKVDRFLSATYKASDGITYEITIRKVPQQQKLPL
ncbi:MAG TPA: hypothetical protein VJK03_02315 [Candidatus Nanoarchaeia archaeon]|nr:hypothetical protein [Candidatus Nanoarchaeia archaeon]